MTLSLSLKLHTLSFLFFYPCFPPPDSRSRALAGEFGVGTIMDMGKKY